jgi:tetratricopeptide (TPR) repeat protein
MTGRGQEAMAAARKLAELVPVEMLATPGFGFLEHWVTRPLQMAIRYGRWETILEAPAPESPSGHATGMWHYAQGRARAALGDPAAAAEHLERLRSIAGDPALREHRLEFNSSAAVLAIAVETLAGKIALARGDLDRAVQHLRRAVENEDALVYGEPPEWSIPARQDLGAALLAAGRPAEAEAVYREDLGRFRENGWSLAGLRNALAAQGRADEADAVATRFRAAWRDADVEIDGSVF